MKIFDLIFDGIISIADSNVEQRQHGYPKLGGFKRDNARLSGDVKKVGQDMAKVIRNRNGSSNKRTCAQQ